ncbi:BTAD domain-containing putative transcriptional regulator [Streptomyces sp. NPDC058657]|uniref:AfsR/SARP family transcriptional regulator n=1 Tax=unclassified Streptomyces TaxID=2593676 RepID=UPI003658A3FF
MKTVLAALLLARGRMVSDARLSHLLWGWSPPATMSAQIYTYISRLRMQLGDGVRIVRQLPGYAMDTGNARVDFLEFERLTRLGAKAQEAGELERADTHLRDALELWRGSALSNVAEFLADTELPRLEEARAAATENRIDVDLALGRHRQVVPELTALVGEFPVRERMRAQLMKALYRCGRQADALTAYHDGRQVLAEELGVDPGVELTAAYQAVLSCEPIPDTLTRPVSALVPPAMLPPDIPDFTGRVGELDQLRRLLPPMEGRSWHARRFLLTGMAGSGKTALAVRAANDCLDAFPDGQLYANLSYPDGSPQDPRTVLVALLRALGEPVGAAEPDLDELIRLYRTRTARRRLLILLDNAVNELQLAPLLPGAPEPAVLITSRTALGPVGGLHTLVLDSLDAEEGLRMLSASVGPARVAAEHQAAQEIVRHCAGLPLALRIVSTRLAGRPGATLGRLAGRLADPRMRLRELQARGLSVPRSLEVSLSRLGPEHRELLMRLSRSGQEVFSARSAAREFGWRPDTVEKGLESLVDDGLLTVSDGPGVPAYRLHALLRLFAGTSCAAEESVA